MRFNSLSKTALTLTATLLLGLFSMSLFAEESAPEVLEQNLDSSSFGECSGNQEMAYIQEGGKIYSLDIHTKEKKNLVAEPDEIDAYNLLDTEHVGCTTHTGKFKILDTKACTMKTVLDRNSAVEIYPPKAGRSWFILTSFENAPKPNLGIYKVEIATAKTTLLCSITDEITITELTPSADEKTLTLLTDKDQRILNLETLAIEKKDLPLLHTYPLGKDQDTLVEDLKTESCVRVSGDKKEELFPGMKCALCKEGEIFCRADVFTEEEDEPNQIWSINLKTGEMAQVWKLGDSLSPKMESFEQGNTHVFVFEKNFSEKKDAAQMGLLFRTLLDQKLSDRELRPIAGTDRVIFDYTDRLGKGWVQVKFQLGDKENAPENRIGLINVLTGDQVILSAEFSAKNVSVERFGRYFIFTALDAETKKNTLYRLKIPTSPTVK